MLKKNVETMEAPQNRRFYRKMECLPLWPTYIGENWRTSGKTYGIKARCHWEQPWGTYWELEREQVGNKGKMKKISPPPPPPKPKTKKKSNPFHYITPSHWAA